MRNPRIHPASFLRRWWLLIAVAGTGGALVAYLYGTRATPTYEAEAQVLVQAGVRPSAEIPTYAEIVRSTPVVAYALRSTGSPLSVEEVRANVRGEADRDTRIITIRAVDIDRSRAVELANGLAAGLEWYVSAAAATTSAAQATEQTPIELIEPATSAARVRPLSLLLLEFGALAGVFGALAFALVVEARRSKVTDEDDLVEVGGFPVLGSVNGAWPRMRTSLLDPTRSSPEEWGDYRRLATRITVASDGAAPRSLVLVGAEGAEASSAVGAKLALTLAQDGQRVVLADFEGDRIRRHFRIGARGGGVQLVKRSAPLTYGSTTLDRFALRSGAPLVVALPRQVSAGLNAEEAENLVRLLCAEADVLIIHAPPPSRSRSALIWARATKATLLVVRAEYTKRADVEEAREGLEPVGTKVIGAVVQGGRP
jgi:capsular polysaccharide biosynthesis protein/Mrp family chromosome partitioning ATPase